MVSFITQLLLNTDKKKVFYWYLSWDDLAMMMLTNSISPNIIMFLDPDKEWNAYSR